MICMTFCQRKQGTAGYCNGNSLTRCAMTKKRGLIQSEDMDMRRDKSFDGFFNSFGVALVLCTLLVSIGKVISYYYFLYIIIFCVLIIFPLAIYDYRRYKDTNTSASCKQKVEGDNTRTRTSSHGICKDSTSCKRAWRNKGGNSSLKIDAVPKYSAKHSPSMKKRQSYPTDENDAHKHSLFVNKSTMKVVLLALKERSPKSLRKRALMNNSSIPVKLGTRFSEGRRKDIFV